MSKAGNFSSQSDYSGSPRRIPAAQGKDVEKDDMIRLNDKFVALIDKVKNLEDVNTKLSTKLKILKEYEVYKGMVDDIVKQEENELKQEIEELLQDQEKLQDDLQRNVEEKEYSKTCLANAEKKKEDLEKDFMIAKQELDSSHLEKVEQTLELEDLIRKLDFLRNGYDEEIKELKSQIQNKTMILPNNSKRSLDMGDFIETVKAQYNQMAVRSREEADHWYQRKMENMVMHAKKHEQNARDIKRDLADLVRQIQKLNGDLESLKRKEDSLHKEIRDVEIDNDEKVGMAHAGIRQLEEALRQAKKDLTNRLREHQELMNIKLALDVEIATYRQLLEGEERRITDFMPRNNDHHLPSERRPPEKHHPPSQPEEPHAPSPTNVPATSLVPPEVLPVSKKRLLIRVNVESGRVLSESFSYTED